MRKNIYNSSKVWDTSYMVWQNFYAWIRFNLLSSLFPMPKMAVFSRSTKVTSGLDINTLYIFYFAIR